MFNLYRHIAYNSIFLSIINYYNAMISLDGIILYCYH